MVHELARRYEALFQTALFAQGQPRTVRVDAHPGQRPEVRRTCSRVSGQEVLFYQLRSVGGSGAELGTMRRK